MRPLRHYQLDIIFLFFALGVLLWLSLYGLGRLGLSPDRYQWYLGGPVIVYYTLHLWHIRRNIRAADRREVTTKTLIYWIALGSILFASYQAPLPAARFWSFDLLFIIFTLHLADSYWDFKKLTFENLLNREA